MNLIKHIVEHEGIGLDDQIRRISRQVNAGGTAAGGATVDATYIVVSANGTLTTERVLTAGTGISFVDNGAGGTFVVSSSAAATTSIARLYLHMGS